MPNKTVSVKQTKQRIFFVFAGVVVVATLLLVRLAFLNIFNYDFYISKSTYLWTSDTTVQAKRGEIVDAKGIVLAESVSAKTVIARPGQIPELQREAIARNLSQVLSLTFEDILKKISDTGKSYVNIKRQVSNEEARQIEELHMPGIDFTPEPRRSYLYGSLAEQILGYTDIDGNGQEGLEARYNKYLRGTPGRTVAEIDSTGRTINNGAEQLVQPSDGAKVKLTIDATVQVYLEKALQEAYEINNAKTAQGLVMDCKTGAIIAMATLPSFDLNNPPRNDLDSLRSLSRNRVIADAYEPGSTFKIITLAAALDSGSTHASDHFACTGGRTIDGEYIRCWSRNHTSSQTLAEGVQNSCNPVFMDLALRMGTDNFYRYIENFGFGQLTKIKLTGEAGGIVRNPNQVRTVDLARIGFGQSIAVTPVQLATAVSAVVNGGRMMQPYIVSEIIAQDGTVLEKTEPTVIRQVISPETSALVAEMLEGVVRDGSGRNAYIPGYRVGGKTGTAQKYENGQIAQGKNVASFLSFAPVEDPRFVVLIIVDEPNISSQIFGSTVAAPYARSVMYDTLRYYKVVPNYDNEESAANVDVEVPDLRGMGVADAKKALSEKNLTSQADGKGSVINQVPVPGSVVPQKTSILLYTTQPDIDQEDPIDAVIVPNLTYKDLATAYTILDDLGLEIEVEGDSLGKIVMQDPGYGTRLHLGDTVKVILRSDDN